MKATVEPLEGNKVKLSVEVDEQEFETAVNAAFKKLAGEVRIPGFRPGKAPRKILEARLGAEVGRTQALHDAIPDYYAQAVREHDVDVIAAPQIDITDGEDGGSVQFDAVVEVRPVVVVPGYESLRVELEVPVATDEEIDAQLERMRAQQATLAVVDRPATDGDSVSIDIQGSLAGEPLEGLTADDYLYEVGSGIIVPEVDDELRGAKAGDILEFSAEHPDPDEDDVLEFRVLVKEVKAKVLPDLDDAFAAEASEFETLDELRADLEHRLGSVKKMQAQMALREKVGEALAELVADEIPEALVNGEMQERLQDLAMRLQAQGMTLEQWLDMSGRTQDDFVAELRDTATQAVKVDLALRAVVEAEEVEVDDDELDAEYAKVAARLELDAATVRKEFERADQVSAIRSDIKKRKALDWLVETVTIVDDGGDPIDRALLEIEAVGDEADSSTPDAGTSDTASSSTGTPDADDTEAEDVE